MNRWLYDNRNIIEKPGEPEVPLRPSEQIQGRQLRPSRQHYEGRLIQAVLHPTPIAACFLTVDATVPPAVSHS